MVFSINNPSYFYSLGLKTPLHSDDSTVNVADGNNVLACKKVSGLKTTLRSGGDLRSFIRVNFISIKALNRQTDLIRYYGTLFARKYKE